MHVDAVPAGGDCHAEAFVITLDLAHMMPLELALGRAALIDAKSLDLQRVFAADLFIANAVKRQRLENVHEVAGNQVGLGHRSEEHTSELQSRGHLVCRLLLETK